MITKLIVLVIIALIVYLIFSGNDLDDNRTKRYDDKVVEFVNGSFMLVDVRERK